MENFEDKIKLHNDLQRFQIEKSIVGSEAYNIEQDLMKGISQEEILEKARSGIYKPTKANLKEGIAGQKYGSEKKEIINKEISFTDFMNSSLNFRNKLIKYCTDNEYEAQEIRSVLGLLDAIDSKAQNDKSFRNEFYKWLKKEKGYSTIKLRELSKQAGYDYWKNLSNSNIIDTFDSITINNSK